ncbi:hypothetical protein JAAARDRAFT_33346 [Jaapia argillacea MUCL 33604]|uniref:Major facilitator superfamily (MFS) profile domain-containing protein n=1 Tax=Jaapia argillacea MUCL 33604 TaxID=933084 RepID=A0A067PYH8_9AGAM|nr:hypothetical protein JAAARDRAFT_33346 [Jaapia argillacea MUCL 33604]
MISLLLVNLDQTIVATALPRIASQFDALTQAAWIATAYMLTLAGFMLMLGQVLTIAPAKYVYLCSIFVFEVGSLICGAAPSFNVLVFGRAIAGCGGGGVVNSVLVIIAQTTRIEDRPLLYGILGGVYALASIVGPLLGGAFTDHVSWRWCFYVNLPFGALAIAVVFLFLPSRPALGSNNEESLNQMTWYRRLDWLGGILCLGTVVSLLLPLQWGGTTHPWNSPVIIALFCVFAVVLVAWIIWEWRRSKAAILPLMLFKRRSQLGATLESFFIGMGMLNGTYYLPLWYQAKGQSSTSSGISILPFMISLITASMVSGGMIKFTGRYWHLLVISPLLALVGSVLLSTLHVDTPNSHAIGFQILYGIGLGGALQNVFIAVQAEWAKEEHMVPQATTVLTFGQVTGGVLGIAIGGTIFSNQLEKNLHVYAPDLPANLATAVEQSVNAISLVEASMRPLVLRAYTESINRVFLLGIPAAALASLSGFLVRNISLKGSDIAIAVG